MQAHVDWRRKKLEICQRAAATLQQAVLAKAWRSWQALLQTQAAQRERAQRAVSTWQNGCLAACWRAWAARALHKRQVMDRATAFICESLRRHACVLALQAVVCAWSHIATGSSVHTLYC